MLKETTIIQNYLHNKVNVYSTNIDNYLSDSNTTNYDESRSYLYLIASSSYSKRDKQSTNISIKARLKLPKLSKKFSLFIESLGEDEEEKDSVKGEKETSEVDIKEQKDQYGLGIAHYFDVKDYFKSSMGVGVRLNSSFDQYIRIKAKKDFDITDEWDLNLRQKFYLFAKRGFESTSGIEFERDLGNDLHFSNYNQYLYKEKTRVDSFSNNLSLTKQLTKKSYNNYSIGIHYNNESSSMKIKDYTLASRYTYYIEKWLYWQITPSVRWEREYDFHEDYILTFSIGMHAGNK